MEKEKKINDDVINRRAAIDALWKALYEYEDETEKQFQNSKDLDLGDWMGHRIFVQNMNDIDRQTILKLPSAQKRGKWKHHYEILEKTSEYVISASGYECSECGTMFHNQWDFCGNCGAVMEKVDEN